MPFSTNFQSVITQLAMADVAQKIGDIKCSSTLDHTSALMSSIAASSAKGKTAMLVSGAPTSLEDCVTDTPDPSITLIGTCHWFFHDRTLVTSPF